MIASSFKGSVAIGPTKGKSYIYVADAWLETDSWNTHRAWQTDSASSVTIYLLMFSCVVNFVAA